MRTIGSFCITKLKISITIIGCRTNNINIIKSYGTWNINQRVLLGPNICRVVISTICRT